MRSLSSQKRDDFSHHRCVYSDNVAHKVTFTSNYKALYTLKTIRFHQFWPPDAVHANGALQNKRFENYVSSHDIRLHPVPSRRHRNSMTEPRHRVVCSVLLRLRRAKSNAPDTTLAILAVCVSNNFYTSNVVYPMNQTKDSRTQMTAHPPSILYPEMSLSCMTKMLQRKSLIAYFAPTLSKRTRPSLGTWHRCILKTTEPSLKHGNPLMSSVQLILKLAPLLYPDAVVSASQLQSKTQGQYLTTILLSQSYNQQLMDLSRVSTMFWE